MSHESNTKLIEEAFEWADRWEGTLHAELIRLHVSVGDLEAVREDIGRARTDWYDLEERYVGEYDEVY